MKCSKSARYSSGSPSAKMRSYAAVSSGSRSSAWPGRMVMRVPTPTDRIGARELGVLRGPSRRSRRCRRVRRRRRARARCSRGRSRSRGCASPDGGGDRAEQRAAAAGIDVAVGAVARCGAVRRRRRRRRRVVGACLGGDPCGDGFAGGWLGHEVSIRGGVRGTRYSRSLTPAFGHPLPQGARDDRGSCFVRGAIWCGWAVNSALYRGRGFGGTEVPRVRVWVGTVGGQSDCG